MVLGGELEPEDDFHLTERDVLTAMGGEDWASVILESAQNQMGTLEERAARVFGIPADE